MSSTFLDGFASEAEFAEELGISLRTARNYRNRPNGLPYAKPGKVVFIPVKEGREWIASHIVKPNPTS